MIRNSILNQPMTWFFNRNTDTFPTVVGTQDYTRASVLDLSFVEGVSIADDEGNKWQLKDVYNNMSLSPSSFKQRPNAMSVESSDSTNGCVFRFIGVPDKIYQVVVTYQKLAPEFGPFFISSVANHSGAFTTYTGIFNTQSFPTGSVAVITGFTNSANNGSFVVTGVTGTTLTVSSSAGAAETKVAYVSNFSWAPIPDQYSDVYNNLFLAEALSMVDDPKVQMYRQRGVAALLAKASGLTEMQKNAFAQQWLARGTERASAAGIVQLGNTGRGI